MNELEGQSLFNAEVVVPEPSERVQVIQAISDACAKVAPYLLTALAIIL